MNFQGIPITIETPKGALHTGPHHEGPPRKMTEDYGYIRGTLSHDGDEVDCFIGPYKDSRKVFIIDQHKDGEFDESKIFLGFNKKREALKAYRKSYGPAYASTHRIGHMFKGTIAELKDWLAAGGGQRPAAEDMPEHQRGGAVTDKDDDTDFFVLPHDVITHLGRGDPDVGTVVAYDMFASPGYTMANPYILPPETVRDLGHGNLQAGRQVLQQFVAKVREQHQ